MNCAGLIEYLQGFEPEDSISVLIIDREKRLVHDVSYFHGITETPTMIFEVSGTQPLDEILDGVERANHE